MDYRVRNSAGIGTLSVLVIIIVLIVIIFTVEMVNNARTIKEANPNTNSQTANTKDVQIPKTAETAGWKDQVDSEFGYAYAFPANKAWESYRTTTSKDSSRYKEGERINTAGVNYTGCDENCGLVFTMLVFTKNSEADPGQQWAEGLMSTNSYYQLASKTNVKKGNVPGIRWEYKAPDNGAAPLVYYYFQHDDYAYAIQINANGAVAKDIDINAEGEKIFSTFKFL